MEKENNVIEFDPNKITYRSRLIDSLLNIRLSLSIKKISSDYIKRSELRKIIDEENKENNIKVRNAINEIFDEFLVSSPKEVESKKEEAKQDISLSIEQMESIIREQEKYSDGANNSKGNTIVKRTSQFNSNGESNNNKAA